MSRNILRLPLLTTAAEIVLGITDFVFAFIVVRITSEWTPEMGILSFYIRLILSVVIFVIIGMLMRKSSDRKTIVKSTTLLVSYSIIVFAIEQITKHFGIYSLNIIWLYLPVGMFQVITSALIRLSTAETINWTYAIPSLFAPFLFVLFSKKNANSDLISTIHR
ncbi:MAG: hypothetical protein ACERKO_07780 [Acetanaerobacterium sp.]